MVLIIGNLVQSPTLRPHPITLLSLIIFILLFRKNIQFRQSFNTKISIKTIISIFILSISVHIVIGFIDFISKDISLIKRIFTFPRLIYGLVLIPVLEELSCRIIIINKFKDKLNQWIIIITTGLYFGMLHAGVYILSLVYHASDLYQHIYISYQEMDFFLYYVISFIMLLISAYIVFFGLLHQEPQIIYIIPYITLQLLFQLYILFIFSPRRNIFKSKHYRQYN